MRYLWGDLTRLLQRYRTRVSLLFVQLAEAHAEDEWPIGSPVQVLQHTELQHRIDAAKQFHDALELKEQLSEAGVALRMTVDPMSNEFHETYGCWPAQWFLAVPDGDASASSPAADDAGCLPFVMTCVSDYDTPDLTLDDFAAHMVQQFGEGEGEVQGQSTALRTVHGLPISVSYAEGGAHAEAEGGAADLPQPSTMQ